MRRFILVCAFAFGASITSAQEPPKKDGQGEMLNILLEALGGVDDARSQLEILKGMNEELRGARGLAAPSAWAEVSKKLMASPSEEVRFQVRALGMAFGDTRAFPGMRAQVADRNAALAARKDALDALVAARDRDLVPVLHGLLADKDLRPLALRALAAFDDPKTPEAVLQAYPSFDGDTKRDALNTLSSRVAYARALLDAVKGQRVPAADVPSSILRQLRNLKDPEIHARLAALWGEVGATSSADKAKEIGRLKGVVQTAGAASDPAHGRTMFAKTCGQCHTLFGAGGKVGPDLTGSNRGDLDYLLLNIVDPNELIPDAYRMLVVKTKDELIVTGILAKKAPDGSLTLVNQTETRTIQAGDIDVVEESKLSLMPEDQLKDLAQQDVRDLIAYLRSPGQTPLLATPDNLGLFFNGKDLAYWDGDPAVFSVQNGEIVGKTAGLKRNEFLKSELALGDFRLILDVKLVNDDGNSGVQFRSEALPDGEVKGYQADVGPGWWGKLYEERGRALLWKESGEAYVKKGDWNQYEILAVGNRVRTAINGHLCVDFDDPPGAKRGIVALQVHAGGATEVRFRNFQVELNPEFQLKTASGQK